MLLMLCAMFSTILFSQNNSEGKAKKDSTTFSYCQIVGTPKLMSTKVNIEIDFGQYKSMWADNSLKDPATGERIVFNSMIDALNYMGKLGWEFAQAYIVTTGSNSVYYYLLKKTNKPNKE